jgi:hypothetical protein
MATQIVLITNSYWYLLIISTNAVDSSEIIMGESEDATVDPLEALASLR